MASEIVEIELVINDQIEVDTQINDAIEVEVVYDQALVGSGGVAGGTVDVYIDGALNQSVASSDLNSEIIDIVI